MDVEHLDHPWLSTNELSAWMTLGAVLEALPPLINGQLRTSAQLNFFEYSILAHLSAHENHSRAMNEIKTLSGSSPSRMTHAINRLEQRGFVTRMPHPDGGRSLLLHLTQLGEAILKKTAPGHAREVAQTIMAALTADQIQALDEICSTLITHNDPALAVLLTREKERLAKRGS